jgi:drug/metabolite transporter (DMT)-like permease
LPDTALAVLLALVSTLGIGGGFVFTQFGLRSMPPWLGAAFSVPTSTLLFWCLAPFAIDVSKADAGAIAVFAGVGLFFPAAVTLLNFESNRLLGANVSGAIAGLGPMFAVLLAVILLDERLHVAQLLGLAAIVGGVTLLYRGGVHSLSGRPLWMLLLPLAAAAIRGGVQPIIKIGFKTWPSPLAAVVVGYTVSSMVLISSALLRNGGLPRGFDRRGACWFAAVGLCNGLGVFFTYAALGHGPVALVSPLVASYPLVTVLLSRLLLKEEPISTRLILAVTATVGGVVLLIVA